MFNFDYNSDISKSTTVDYSSKQPNIYETILSSKKFCKSSTISCVTATA